MFISIQNNQRITIQWLIFVFVWLSEEIYISLTRCCYYRDTLRFTFKTAYSMRIVVMLLYKTFSSKRDPLLKITAFTKTHVECTSSMNVLIYHYWPTDSISISYNNITIESTLGFCHHIKGIENHIIIESTLGFLSSYKGDWKPHNNRVNTGFLSSYKGDWKPHNNRVKTGFFVIIQRGFNLG
jgi:hypothetical protein